MFDSGGGQLFRARGARLLALPSPAACARRRRQRQRQRSLAAARRSPSATPSCRSSISRRPLPYSSPPPNDAVTASTACRSEFLQSFRTTFDFATSSRRSHRSSSPRPRCRRVVEPMPQRRRTCSSAPSWTACRESSSRHRRTTAAPRLPAVRKSTRHFFPREGLGVSCAVGGIGGHWLPALSPQDARTRARRRSTDLPVTVPNAKAGGSSHRARWPAHRLAALIDVIA